HPFPTRRSSDLKRATKRVQLTQLRLAISRDWVAKVRPSHSRPKPDVTVLAFVIGNLKRRSFGENLVTGLSLSVLCRGHCRYCAGPSQSAATETSRGSDPAH